MRPDVKTIVETKSGILQGIEEDGLFVFRGIPYAAPPVGELRWMPPQPPTPWSGIRSAGKFGPIAPQPPMEFQAPREPLPAEPQDEDCLFLNIWTPGIDDKKRAVMVWIHGGAFSLGSGSEPTQSGRCALAKRGGIVLITVNYRLGPLGFLNLDSITGGKIPATGNEGLLDQVAALRWVRDNINAFGGDPNNVTIFGESAGAMSVGALLAMPLTRGLFKKAILQSGASTCHSLDDAAKVAEKLVQVLGLTGSNVDALRKIPVQALIDAQQKSWAWGVRGAPTEPVIDGKILPALPLDAVKSGSAKDTIIMAGSNLDEGTLFAGVEPRIVNQNESDLVRRVSRIVPAEFVPSLIDVYRQALTNRNGQAPTPGQIYIALSGDAQFRMPGLRMVESQQKLGKASYSYLFDWKCTIPEFGACHSLDVGFIFDSTTQEFHGVGPEIERLKVQMQEAWTAFAKTGNPGCPSLGSWPEYGSKRETMVLGANSRVVNAPYEAERVAWDNIANKWLG
jgi:para-nitrobenzyl esterase